MSSLTIYHISRPHDLILEDTSVFHYFYQKVKEIWEEVTQTHTTP